MRCLALALTLSGLVLVPLVHSQDKKEPPGGKWEKAIATFEKSDRDKPPPKKAILFVGSSTIRLWKLDKSFPDLEAINRGFGGSHIADVVQYVSRIVIPYQPRLIVFFAGDNDLASGKAPERVCDDFKAFVEAVRKDLPDTKILFLAVKPSLARWKLFEQQKKTNGLIAAYCRSGKGLVFVDVVPAMLGKDGKPRPELFVKDGLHLSEEGYKLWSALLKPLLQ